MSRSTSTADRCSSGFAYSHQKNHTATQSSFAAPCVPFAETSNGTIGIDSLNAEGPLSLAFTSIGDVEFIRKLLRLPG